MDDKRRKKKNNDNENNGEDGDEWTHVNGGFLPKFLQRRKQKKQKTTASTVTDIPSNTNTNTPNSTSRRSTAIPNVMTINNIVDYKSAVVDEEESIVVVRFFASWCKSCRASEPLFRNIVSRYASSKQEDDHHQIIENDGGYNRRNQVKFVQVQLTKETAYLQEGLGVPSIPYVHVYHPEGGLVEERKFSKGHMAEFARVLESYTVGSCDLPLDDDDDEDEEEGVGDGTLVGVFE